MNQKRIRRIRAAVDAINAAEEQERREQERAYFAAVLASYVPAPVERCPACGKVE